MRVQEPVPYLSDLNEFLVRHPMMNYTFLSATILLLLITDPVGNIPVFANALKHVPPDRRPLVILREIVIAFVLLLTFMFVG